MASPLEARASIAMLETVANRLQPRQEGDDPRDFAEEDRGIGIVSFITALAVALIVFGVQAGLFLALRNKLARIL